MKFYLIYNTNIKFRKNYLICVCNLKLLCFFVFLISILMMPNLWWNISIWFSNLSFSYMCVCVFKQLCFVNAFLIKQKRQKQMCKYKKIFSYCRGPWKRSLMKTQTWILDNRLCYTRKVELRRKGKKSRTVQITPILICPLTVKSLVLITVRRVHYSKMGKAPTTLLPQAFYFVKEELIFFSFWVNHQRVGEFPFLPWPMYFRCWSGRN